MKKKKKEIRKTGIEPVTSTDAIASSIDIWFI